MSSPKDIAEELREIGNYLLKTKNAHSNKEFLDNAAEIVVAAESFANWFASEHKQVFESPSHPLNVLSTALYKYEARTLQCPFSAFDTCCGSPGDCQLLLTVDDPSPSIAQANEAMGRKEGGA